MSLESETERFAELMGCGTEPEGEVKQRLGLMVKAFRLGYETHQELPGIDREVRLAGESLADAFYTGIKSAFRDCARDAGRDVPMSEGWSGLGISGQETDENRLLLLMVTADKGMPEFNGFVGLCRALFGWSEARVRELLEVNRGRGLLSYDPPSETAEPVLGVPGDAPVIG